MDKNNMKFILTQIRRVFFAGLVALILAFICKIDIINFAFSSMGSKSLIALFLLSMPVLYLIFVIISCIYIRKAGQFASVHQSQPFVVSILRCIGADAISPFKNIKGLFYGIFGKNKQGIPDDIFKKTKKSALLLFVWMVFVILVYVVLLGSLIP